MKTALILGANSDIAKDTAKLFLENKFRIILASRNTQELDEFVNKTLQAKKQYVNIEYFDALDYKSHFSFYNSLPEKPDVAILCFGYLGSQQVAQENFEEAKKIIDTNLSGAISITEIIARDFEQRKNGSIIGVSSVAGDRGKSSNYIYCAAKAGFSTYLSGLRQRLNSSTISVTTIKPGFVYTKMTKGLDLPKSLTATPKTVAKAIFNSYKNNKSVVYTKTVWWAIMTIIKAMPEFIYKKLKM